MIHCLQPMRPFLRTNSWDDCLQGSLATASATVPSRGTTNKTTGDRTRGRQHHSLLLPQSARCAAEKLSRFQEVPIAFPGTRSTPTFLDGQCSTTDPRTESKSSAVAATERINFFLGGIIQLAQYRFLRCAKLLSQTKRRGLTAGRNPEPQASCQPGSSAARLEFSGGERGFRGIANHQLRAT